MVPAVWVGAGGHGMPLVTRVWVGAGGHEAPALSRLDAGGCEWVPLVTRPSRVWMREGVGECGWAWGAGGDAALSCLDARGHGWACYEIRTHSLIGHVR